jgi:hypothetical protein
VFHYHDIHLTFAHSLESILNSFILHPVGIYLAPTMSSKQKQRCTWQRYCL